MSDLRADRIRKEFLGALLAQGDIVIHPETKNERVLVSVGKRTAWMSVPGVTAEDLQAALQMTQSEVQTTSS